MISFQNPFNESLVYCSHNDKGIGTFANSISYLLNKNIDVSDNFDRDIFLDTDMAFHMFVSTLKSNLNELYNENTDDKLEKIIKNEIVHGKPVAIKGSEDILKGSIIISSIGSLPEPIEGVPMDGSTYNIVDQESGKFDDLDKVHGMGNAVTGKGNIKASRVSAKTVGDLTIDLLQDVSSDTVKIIDNKVKEWQEKVSYDGNYFEWKAKK